MGTVAEFVATIGRARLRMSALNRWEDRLGKTCAASCWLSPLPLECVAEVYGEDPGSDPEGAIQPARSESRPPRARRAARWWSLWRSDPRAAEL